MQISGADLEKFIGLYEKEYGITLSPEKAREEFSKLLQLLTLVYLTPKSLAEKPEY